MSSSHESLRVWHGRTESVPGDLKGGTCNVLSQELDQLLAASPGTRPGRGVSLDELELRVNASYYVTKRGPVCVSPAIASRRAGGYHREVRLPRAGLSLRLALLGLLDKRQRLVELQRLDGRPWATSRFEGQA